jgi:hypothetical protein
VEENPSMPRKAVYENVYLNSSSLDLEIYRKLGSNIGRSESERVRNTCKKISTGDA